MQWLGGVRGEEWVRGLWLTLTTSTERPTTAPLHKWSRLKRAHWGWVVTARNPSRPFLPGLLGINVHHEHWGGGSVWGLIACVSVFTFLESSSDPKFPQKLVCDS